MWGPCIFPEYQGILRGKKNDTFLLHLLRVFMFNLPGESQGQGSLVGCRLWGRTELDTTEAT